MESCEDAQRRPGRPGDMSPLPGTDRIEHLAQAVAERVVTLVMDAIDVNAILARIDINAILERVDINALVERVDMNQLIENVDFEEILDKIDIDALIEHTEIGTIVAKSTSGVATEVLDVVRSQGVGLDDFVARSVNWFLRRNPANLPLGPPLLVTGAQRTPELTAGGEPTRAGR
jgi:hypothetical protein